MEDGPAAGEPPGPPVLSARGVVRRFGATTVLDGVDLDLAPGELVALVGENGAGKSTLIRCLAGALALSAGEVRCGGRKLAATAAGVQAQGLGVVWQDLALCDNLDAVANLFLGREERGWLLAEARMHARARRLLDDLGVDVPDLRQPVGSLSGGQRQSLAIARAILSQPRVLLLDEPTSALGVKEAGTVDGLLRRLRASGMALLLVSHQMEQVFDLADHIAVLRQGRLAARLSPLEVHPDDVVALMTGVEADSTARRQLHRLHSLVDQLAEVTPAASLPLIVSAIATALGQEQVALHLIDERRGDGPAQLVRRAALGLCPAMLEVTARLPLDRSGGPIAEAAVTGRHVSVDDLRAAPGAPPPLAAAATAAGVVAAWAAPISGSAGVLGVVSGFSRAPGRLHADQLELLSLYAEHAAAAIEREHLMEVESLRRSHRHQRAFLSRLSHELRTPLTAICGYASSLNQPDVTWDERDQHRFLELIESESARLGRLVGDLLDSSAIDSGVLRLQGDWCDLGLVVEAAAACVRPAGPHAAPAGAGAPVAVEVEVDPGVGPVWGDHDRLEQVFVNLLENAARHGRSLDGVQVTITPGAPGWVEARVRDRGPGIPPELAETVFDAAQRGPTLAVGHGLGLAIARGIVEAHGGTVVVEPPPAGGVEGKPPGATLLVTLPIEGRVDV